MGGGEGRTRQRVRDRGARTHNVQGDFSVGEETVPKVVRKVRVGGREDGDDVVFLTALSAGLDLWICGGTNVTGNRCERKYSLRSNEVSLSTMRLGRGKEWAVKKVYKDGGKR